MMLPIKPMIADTNPFAVAIDPAPSGVYLSGLDGDGVRCMGGGAVNIDLAGNATLESDDPLDTIETMSLLVWNTITGDSFSVDGANGVTVSDGLVQGSVISVGQTQIGTVEVGDESGFNIVFNAAATPALVQSFLRSVTYVSASPADS